MREVYAPLQLADISLSRVSHPESKFASLGSAAKSGSLHDDVLHCYACTVLPLMLLTILYELLINLSVHKMSANGNKTPVFFVCSQSV